MPLQTDDVFFGSDTTWMMRCPANDRRALLTRSIFSQRDTPAGKVEMTIA